MATTPRLNVAVLTTLVSHLQAAITTLGRAGVAPGTDADFGTVYTVLENAKDLAHARIKALNAPAPVPQPIPARPAAPSPVATVSKAAIAELPTDAPSLRAMARSHGLPDGGVAEVLRQRIADHLSGKPAAAPTVKPVAAQTVATPVAAVSKPELPSGDSPSTLKALRALCVQYGLPDGGVADVMRQRLTAHLSGKATVAPAPVVHKTPAVVTEVQTDTRPMDADTAFMANGPTKCSGTRKDGKPCGAIATRATGLCKRHAEQGGEATPTVYPANTILIADGKGGLHQVSLADVLGTASDSELWAALEQKTARKAA